MSCRFKIQVPVQELNKIYKNLSKNSEIAGVLKYDVNNNFIKTTTNVGDSTSVLTPNHVVNYHTHPIEAYQDGDAVWGWPSGEDIRETIKFGLAGNKAHLVFTCEGLYTIQINPCKLYGIRTKLNDTERGILVFLIEEYFKHTHNFRCVEEVNTFSKKGVYINPHSYVDLINSFELNNIIPLKKQKKTSKKNSVGSAQLPKNGFLTYSLSSGKIHTNPFYENLSDKDLSNIYEISSKGEELKKISPRPTINYIKSTLQNIFSKLNEFKCTNRWNNTSENNKNLWFYISFYETDYYKSGDFFDKQEKVYKVPNSKILPSVKLNPSNQVHINIFSNNSGGCSIREVEHVNKFSTSVEKSSKKSTFGNQYLTPEERYIFYVFVFYTHKNKKVNIKKISKRLGIPQQRLQEELVTFF